MEKSTTAAGVVPAAIVEEAWQQVGVSFERFCLTAGIAMLGVSIIVLNYNYARFLAEAIDSVLNQYHPVWRSHRC
jgi:hypothetical protein